MLFTGKFETENLFTDKFKTEKQSSPNVGPKCEAFETGKESGYLDGMGVGIYIGMGMLFILGVKFKTGQLPIPLQNSPNFQFPFKIPQIFNSPLQFPKFTIPLYNAPNFQFPFQIPQISNSL